MKSLQVFLEFIYNNYVSILVCIGLVIGIVKNIIAFVGKTKTEKIEIVKRQIHEVMLKMITSAEIDFEQWDKSGEIKRSQVIAEIYNKYPILSKVVNHDELITWIDNEINNSLETLKGILEENRIINT